MAPTYTGRPPDGLHEVPTMHAQSPRLGPTPVQDATQLDRVVLIDGRWFFRVRGGKVVGPYPTVSAAAEAVAAYRAACMGTLSLHNLWRPWRKQRSDAGLTDGGMRHTSS